uniref:NADH dehydrogenase subunit 4L n=1 Tax=Parasteatoda cingulata TaxID=2905676 RepID=UPI0022388849|nr:NADH dehydrogenase subunit 4L [Parasteatoda cingulata]UYG23922.1 NADH dehydrogenase subunit 4L [Parasteatoda cingulata]
MIMIINMISILWWRKNIIILLLNLELLLISLFSIMLVYNLSSSFISALIMLTIMVSGSSIGLSMLVSLSQSHHSSKSSFMWMLTFDKIYSSINYNYLI